MGEIKFRAWLPKRQEMTEPMTIDELLAKKRKYADARWLRYAEMNDSDGCEIYEDDIVDLDDGEKWLSTNVHSLRGVVTMSEGSWLVVNEARDEAKFLWHAKSRFPNLKINVIGNVHANPELILLGWDRTKRYEVTIKGEEVKWLTAEEAVKDVQIRTNFEFDVSGLLEQLEGLGRVKTIKLNRDCIILRTE